MDCMRLRSYAKVRGKLTRLSRSLLSMEKIFYEVREDLKGPPRSLIQPATRDLPVGPADLVLQNARLADSPTPVTIAIRDNRIVFAGAPDSAESFLADSTEVVDAEGKTVLPGFCDSHLHLLVGAERLRGCSVEDVQNGEELKRRVSEFADAHPDEEVLHIYGVHYTDPPIIPARTARTFLDEIVSDRPLFLYAHDLHTAWANSCAIGRAGLLKPAPPFPPLLEYLDLTDGFVLDEEGLPSGELREPPVYFLVEGPLHEQYPLSVEQKLEYLKTACLELAQLGITRVHNMGLAFPEEDLEILLMLLELEEKGELPIRVFSSYSVLPDEHLLTDVSHAARAARTLASAREEGWSYAELHETLLSQLEEVAELRHEAWLDRENRSPGVDGGGEKRTMRGYSADLRSLIHRLHIKPHRRRAEERKASGKEKRVPAEGKVFLQTVKLFMDGVVEKNTAFRMDRPPVEGIPGFDPTQLELVVTLADRLGLSVAGHCIGDGSVRGLLEAVEAARRENRSHAKSRGHNVRHRIEHIELCDPVDVSRFRELEVIASMQPFHERAPWTLWHQLIPEERWDRGFLWKDLCDSRATLVFGSDWPIVSCDCLKAVQHAINREAWKSGLRNQALSTAEAMAAFSTNAAIPEYMENQVGEVAPGMLADMVLLSGDVESTAPGSLEVELTICDGRIVYRK